MFNLEELSSGQAHQKLLEQECLVEGGIRYREQTTNLIQDKAESRTDYGKKLAATTVKPLADAIRVFLAESAKGPGRGMIAANHLALIEPEIAAYIGVKTILDSISTRSYYQTAASAIGGRIEDELRLTRFEGESKPLYAKCLENFNNSPDAHNTKYRRRVLLRAMAKFEISWKEWSTNDKFHVGSKIIDLLIQSTGLVQLARNTERNNTTIYLEATDALVEKLNEWRENGEVTHPERQPMVCPPKPWTTPFDGGYYTKRLRSNMVKTMLRGHQVELAGADMEPVYRAVNALQDTPWKINTRMLDIINQVWDAGLEVGDMASRLLIPKEPEPEFISDDPQSVEKWKEWKLRVSESFRQNRRNDSKRIQTLRILSLSEKFKNYPAIWFPIRLDFRGRMYAIPHSLNPQASDLAKGVLTLAEGKPLGERGAWWLAVHLANTYGYDKVPLRDRRLWTLKNYERIVATAADPLADLWWTEADKPFQFLAACLEWAGFSEEGNGYVCSLPIMVDGSCNGLQHFSAILRDEVCGTHVNMTDSPTPSDIYATVAERVKALLRANTDTYASIWLAYGIDRNMTKRPTMVLPYGGTMEAVKQYTYEYCLEQADAEKARPGTGKANPFGRDLRKACNWLASTIWKAMDDVVVGPRKAMDWLREVSKTVAAENLPLTWTTPAGFLVQQRYPDLRKVRVKTKIGDQVIMVTLHENKPSLDKRKQAQAIPPNFVHSLDAAALMLTVNACQDQGVHSFAAIHDSYGTLPADMDTLATTLRQVFVKLYSERDVLADLAAEIGGVLPEGKTLPLAPDKGSLDLNGVLKSEFFFS